MKRETGFDPNGTTGGVGDGATGADWRATVVIPVFGREDVFGTVAFLREREYARRLRFVVVDNGNADGLSAKLSALKGDDCEVVRLARNSGGSGAFRAGMAAALERDGRGFVWLLDDDALVNERTLPALVGEWRRLSEEGGKPGAVGSAMLGRRNPGTVIEVGSGISRLTSKQRPRFHGKTLAEIGERTDAVEYVAAASLLTTAEVLREVGVFEDVFIHFDDIDWCFRVRAAGYGVFATTRSCVNHMEGSAKVANWIVYYNYRNRLWFLKRHFPALHKLVFCEMLAALCLFVGLGRSAKARMVWLGMRHSVSGRLLMRDELPQ